MATKEKINHIRLVIPKGTQIITERGNVDIEDLRVNDQVLTDQKTFIPVKHIEKTQSKAGYILAAHGLKTIKLDEKAKVFVRDVDFIIEQGKPVPIVSWPYWVSVKEFEPFKQLVLSPYNPHSLNPYAAISSRNANYSTYLDQDQQKWIQIEKFEDFKELVDSYCVELEEDKAIASDYLLVK